MNRFTAKATASAGKHVYSPTKILHISNFEESVSIEVCLFVTRVIAFILESTYG